MGAYLEFGTGCSCGENSFEVGKAAALMAYKTIKKYEPNLVLVFSPVKYDHKMVLKGVREVTGKILLIGGTSPGGICRGFRENSVVVTIVASPYLSVHEGVGCNVSKDYRKAVQEAIDKTGKTEYFDEFQPRIDSPQIDLDYAKKCFAFVFMPGATTRVDSFNHDIIDLIRRRSLNAIPLVGGCTGDDFRWQENYQFINGDVVSDSLVFALVETHLKFGVATAWDHLPLGLQASITRVQDYEIKEFYHEPAADFYASLINISLEELKKDPRRYFAQYPMGVSDEFGNYSVIMGVEVTPDSGIRCLRKPYLNATVTILQRDQEKIRNSTGEVIGKAAYRGRMSRPSACLVFSSVYRHRFSGLPEVNKIIRESMSKLRKNHVDLDYTGFISYGETGVNDEGVSLYMDHAISCLLIADELNSASTVAFKNKILYEELSDTAIRNQVLYEELSAVYDMSNLLNASLDLHFVMNKAVEMVGRFFQEAGCGLFIYEQKTESFQMVGLYNQKELPKNIDWKTTLPYYALMREEPVIVNEIKGNQMVSSELNKYTQAKSIIAAPIIIKGEKIGVISVYSRQAHCFSQNDLEFLQTLSNQIGSAIINARLFEKTQKLAYSDGLTGLYDHNHFLKVLDRQLATAAAKKHPISLVMVDLDDFKYCNDKYGHTVGDIILKETAEILKGNVRNDDIIARYGGDEFVIILVNAAKERAFKIAERIRCKIAQAAFDDPESDNSFGITASIGIATFPDDAATAKNLIDSADKAMYRVKRKVKNKSLLYFSDFAELEKEFSASEKAFFDTIKILVQILDTKDRYTWEHSRQVADYAVQLADTMGLSKDEKYWLRLTGYLHDIGKIHVSSEIVNKKGRLDNDEFAVIKLHPIVGANLLSPIKGFKKMVPIIYHHHEWFDGSGYPDGLSGCDIPKGARILAIVDGFDAMTSNRPYRKAQTVEWALEELTRKKGNQYDPEIVDAFINMIEQEIAKESRKGRRQTDKGVKKTKKDPAPKPTKTEQVAQNRLKRVK